MVAKHLTYDRIRELLDYEPATGMFIRKVRTSQNAKVGQIAGSINGCGYVNITVDRVKYQAHRLAWLWMTGEWPKKEHIDHINRVKSDNRWCNLREATTSENGANAGPSKNNKCGVKGVSWHPEKNKWCVYIGYDNRRFYLGAFATIEEAAAMFEGAARMLRGEFHSQNQYGEE